MYKIDFTAQTAHLNRTFIDVTILGIFVSYCKCFSSIQEFDTKCLFLTRFFFKNAIVNAHLKDNKF